MAQTAEPSDFLGLGDEALRGALEAMQDHVAIGEAVRDDSGTITDFTIVYMNQQSIDGAGRTRSEMVGHRVCDLYPNWRSSGVFDQFVAIVETGDPWVVDRLRYDDVSPEGTPISGYWSLSTARFGDGYVTSSRNVTDLVLAEEQRRAEIREQEQYRVAIEVLQRASLPELLPDVAGLDIAAIYEPAQAEQPVGGDWYDVFDLGHDRVGVVIADVAGHGPDAAAFMVQVRNVVRALAIEHGAPSQVLGRANAVVGRLHEQSLFATCCYGVVDTAIGTFSWALAGHFAPLVITDKIEFARSDVGPPLGVAEGTIYRASQITLNKGDRVVLFTDGLVENRTEALDKRLEVLRSWAAELGEADAQTTVETLAKRAEDRSDDLAMVCFRMA